jgi:endonuclease YncB( thermonuclease family)
VSRRGVLRSLLLAFIGSALCLFCAGPAKAWSGTAIRILGGSSLVAAKPGGTMVKVCFYGIRVPEADTRPGEKARTYAERKAEGRTIQVQQLFVNDRGCRVGVVSFSRGGASLNERMVRAGFARVDPRRCAIPSCGRWYDLEKRARLEKRGLWSSANGTLRFPADSRAPGFGRKEMFRCPSCELR